MKKILSSILMFGVSALMVSAQTEFRNITFEEGLAAAKQEGKLVFIDFFTTWCGPCKMMAAKTFPLKEVGDYMNAKFIPLKLDAEKEGAELKTKYGVNSFPTYVIVNPEGERVAKFSGYMDGSTFLNQVQAALDPERSPERIKARYEAGERTPLVVSSYAYELAKNRQEKSRMEVIDSYFNLLNDAERLNPDNAFIFTIHTSSLDSNLGKFMIEHYADFPVETQPKIKEVLGELTTNKLNEYFGGYMFRDGSYDAAEFAKFKQLLSNLGLEKPENTVIYEFVEKRPGMTDLEYLDYTVANFDSLTDYSKVILIYNLTNLVSPKTPETKEGISKFLRSKVSTLSPMGIQIAGRTLQGVEGE